MSNKDKATPKAYPLDFIPYPPTPNHNPLIKESLHDTCYDILAVTDFLNNTVLSHFNNGLDGHKMSLSQRQTWGLQCILHCITEALNYEMHHRPPEDN